MQRKALVLANLAVLLFGLAGLFAKWVHLPALEITFGRVLFSSIALGLYMRFRRMDFHIVRPRDCWLLAVAGIVLALHWWTFLLAIQVSTVAIGTLTFASFPLFLTFLEPAVLKRRLSLSAVLFAALILIGVVVTIPELSLENHMVRGIVIGMASAFLYAVLTLLNQGLADRHGAVKTAFYEQAVAAIVLLPFVLRVGVLPTAADLGLLLFLGLVTTALAHTLFISSLKDLPAHLAGIISSMETVYGILFAFLLLREVPSARELIGAGIIVAAVVAAQAVRER